MSSSEPRSEATAGSAEEAAADAARASCVRKAAFVAFGVPAATWFAIRVYWNWLYWKREVPLYYFGTMGGLRVIVFGPLQVFTMAVFVLMWRRLLSQSSWFSLAVLCAAAGVMAGATDAVGMTYLDREGAEAAHLIWDLTPFVVGPTVLVVWTCVQGLRRWTMKRSRSTR